MPISVTCRGCKKRFSVSEKFAGQKGPCPKCKAEIEIPALEDQVVVHAPEDAGPKDAAGRSISKPILREETKFSPMIAAGIGVAIIAVLIFAFVIRGAEEIPWIVSALGALLLAPPLVLGGYTFLRDDELEAHVGQELLVRLLSCAGAYAFLWGAYWFCSYNLGPFTVYQLLYIIPPLVMAGGFAAYAALDLEYMMGLVHYGLYLLVTGGLALFVGVKLFESAGG
jgi:hypothetical protein